MNNTTPQLSPAEYGMTTTEQEEVAPDLEPSAEVAENVEEVEVVVAPDTEPPTTIGEDEEILSSDEEDTEFLAPEFSPPGTEKLESVEEEFVAPEELPPTS